MMKKFLKKVNEQHWYIIGGVAVIGFFFWLYGCQSLTESLLTPGKSVARDELQIELNYLVEKAKLKFSDLDRQDETKKFILEQLQIIGTQGSFNPAGLLNAVITVGAITFGLDRNRKYKLSNKTKKITYAPVLPQSP